MPALPVAGALEGSADQQGVLLALRTLRLDPLVDGGLHHVARRRWAALAHRWGGQGLQEGSIHLEGEGELQVSSILSKIGGLFIN